MAIGVVCGSVVRCGGIVRRGLDVEYLVADVRWFCTVCTCGRLVLGDLWKGGLHDSETQFEIGRRRINKVTAILSLLLSSTADGHKISFPFREPCS